MPAVALDAAGFKEILHTIYPNDIHYAVYALRGTHFLAMVPKYTKWTGGPKQVTVNYASGGGRSASFSTAQGNSSPSKHKSFMVERVSDYKVCRIKDEVIRASAGDADSIVSAVKKEMDTAIYDMNRSLSQALAGDGSGAIGRINGAPSGGTLQLANATDRRNFEVGKYIVANPTRVGSAGTMRAGRGLVTKRSSTGAITYTAEGSWAPQANDYLFIEGDYGSKLVGLDGWIPDVAPTPGENFLGLDRSVDREKLAGFLVDQTGAADTMSAIIDGLNQMAGDGCNPDHAFMGTTEWGKVLKAVEGKSQYQREKVEARVKVGEGAQTREVVISVGTIVVDTQSGPVRLVPDPDIKPGRVYPLRMDTWELRSLGEAPFLEKTDAGELRVVENDDAREMRVKLYGNLLCEAPDQNGVILMP